MNDYIFSPNLYYFNPVDRNDNQASERIFSPPIIYASNIQMVGLLRSGQTSIQMVGLTFFRLKQLSVHGTKSFSVNSISKIVFLSVAY